MKKVGIIGHYGFGHDLANGQTIKTKIITKELEKYIGNSAYKVDVHGGIKIVVPTIFKTIKSLRCCTNIIIMLTENGLKVCVPILAFFNRIFKRKLHYIVIGGWLAAFLKKNMWLIPCLKKFDCIYVETTTMKNALEELGLKNLVVMPNCKELSIVHEKDLKIQFEEPLKLCTFSRVMEEKGIGDAVYAVKKINEMFERVVFELTIFGQIDEKQIDWFEDLKKSFPAYINYGGVVSFDKSVDSLKEYYALLFPTKFYTEGIPGTIIDAYAAGLPVISSEWESFSDVVEEGKTGIGYKFADKEALIETLKFVVLNPNKIIEMKSQCILKANQYTLEKGTEILKKALI
nr:glycosyltransferase [uncultured Blautia sp.]